MSDAPPTIIIDLSAKIVFDPAALEAAGRLAAEGEFAPHGPESWAAYRETYSNGPNGADVAEMLASMLAFFLPGGGYEIMGIESTTTPGDGPRAAGGR
jgi:hypothetical protein